MSVYHQILVTCNCGSTNRVKAAHGVNINRMPEIRNAIIDGNFHRSVCPSCGETLVVEKEFLYSDFSRNTFIKVMPRKNRHLWKETSAELDADISRLPKSLCDHESLYRRVAFGLGELREKLIAQDAGIDDRLVELAKVYLVYEHPFLVQKPRLRIELAEAGQAQLDFIALHDHSPQEFKLAMPRGIVAELEDRRDEMQRWVTESHQHQNIFTLEDDHWINIWRWAPSNTALAYLEKFVKSIRDGNQINTRSQEFKSMLTYLPRGTHLPAWAKRSLKEIYTFAQDQDLPELMDYIFEIRFDVQMDDDWAYNNNPDDMDTLWDLLRDLPDANVEGNTYIESINLETGSGGFYNSKDKEIGIGSGLLWSQEPFEDTVRHEVGHAVQEQLDRERNMLVSNWLRDEFGWREFGDSKADIEYWVNLMGGFGTMTTKDEKKVHNMLEACLGQGEQWSPPNLPHVPHNHPWRKSGFGPRLAFQKTGQDWYENHHRWYRYNGMAFFVNFYYRSFMVVNEDTLALIDQMPDTYAAMSPYEFFAELYALHYDLDDPQRGNIPQSITDWLNNSVGKPETNAPVNNLKPRNQAMSPIIRNLSERDDGTKCITYEETIRRTINMVAADKGLDPSNVKVTDDLTNDLNYSKQDKRDLQQPIDNQYFSDVNASADRDDLEKSTTVANLASRIYQKYIPNENHC